MIGFFMKVKMCNKIICILVLSITNLFAAIPTLEGLFQNSSNVKIEGNLVVLKIMVENKNNSENLLSDGSLIADSGKALSTPKNKYYKFLFSSNPEKSKFELMQIEYSRGKMDAASIVGKLYFNDFTKTLSGETRVERDLFFSVLTMLSTNNANNIINFSRRYGTGFKANNEFLNKEKDELLNKYKNYLAKIKENKELKETLKSPLKPEDREEYLKVKALMRSNLFLPNEKIKLIRKNGNFFWKADLESVKIFFSNKSHQLNRFEVDHNLKSLELYLSEYILFDGRHIFPKVIFLKMSNDSLYKVKILSFQEINSTKKTMSERSIEYDDVIKKIRSVNMEAKEKEDDLPVKKAKLSFLF